MSLYLGIYYIAKQEKTPKIPHVDHIKRKMSFLCLVNKLYQTKILHEPLLRLRVSSQNSMCGLRESKYELPLVR